MPKADTTFADTNLHKLSDLPLPQVSATFDKQVDEIVNAGAAGSSITFPFQIYDTSTPMVQQVHVRYGTCNDVEPTNVDTDIAVSAGVNTLYLKVTVNLDGVQTAVELDIATTGQPADTDYEGYITLGQVTVSGGLITSIDQAATHSLRMAMCGRIVTTGSLTFRGTYEFWGF